MQLETLRQIMSKFATGVTVVTTKQGDGIHGLMVKAFTAVPLEPPLILICVQKKGSSHSCISQNESFLVNILSDAQKDLAERFADPQLGGPERFESVASRWSSHGNPILAGHGRIPGVPYSQYLGRGRPHHIFSPGGKSRDWRRRKVPDIFRSPICKSEIENDLFRFI